MELIKEKCPICGGICGSKEMDDGGYVIYCYGVEQEYEEEYWREEGCGLSFGDLSYGDYHIGEGENKGSFKTKEEVIEKFKRRV